MIAVTVPVLLVGSVTREIFAERCEIVNFGYGDHVGMRAVDLPERIDRRVMVDPSYAYALAARRNAKHDGVMSRRIARGSTDLEIHRMGLLGECAAGQYFGVAVDETENPDGGDAGYDLVIEGRTVNVRARQARPDPYLVFPSLAKFTADVALLALVYSDGRI